MVKRILRDAITSAGKAVSGKVPGRGKADVVVQDQSEETSQSPELATPAVEEAGAASVPKAASTSGPQPAAVESETSARTPAQRAVAEEAPVERVAARPAPAKKAPSAPATARKAPAKKAPAKKSPAKPAAAKKAPAPPATAGAAPAEPAPAKAAATKKTAVKKAPVKKAAATKAAVTKAAASKAPASKQAPASKPPASKQAPASKPPAAKPPAKRARSAKKATAAAQQPSAKPDAAGEAPTAAPFPVKKGEQPWTEAELADVRSLLHSERELLIEEIADADAALAEMLRDAGEGSGDDQADAGSRTFEREQEISLAANSVDKLSQVDRALARLDNGSYGSCENCGKPIGKVRLQNVPRATLCLECKAREERR